VCESVFTRVCPYIHIYAYQRTCQRTSKRARVARTGRQEALLAIHRNPIRKVADLAFELIEIRKKSAREWWNRIELRADIFENVCLRVFKPHFDGIDRWRFDCLKTSTPVPCRIWGTMPMSKEMYTHPKETYKRDRLTFLKSLFFEDLFPRELVFPAIVRYGTHVKRDLYTSKWNLQKRPSDYLEAAAHRSRASTVRTYISYHGRGTTHMSKETYTHPNETHTRDFRNCLEAAAHSLTWLRSDTHVKRYLPKRIVYVKRHLQKRRADWLDTLCHRTWRQIGVYMLTTACQMSIVRSLFTICENIPAKKTCGFTRHFVLQWQRMRVCMICRRTGVCMRPVMRQMSLFRSLFTHTGLFSHIQVFFYTHRSLSCKLTLFWVSFHTHMTI